MVVDQRAKITWRETALGAVPVSTQFDDPYYSLDDGMAETTHVFLGGNDLPGRFMDGFHIAELGFGTGLNLLVALDAFRKTGLSGRLRFTSFEAFPMAPDAMRQAQAAFPGLSDIASELASYWSEETERIVLDDLDFTLIQGDARVTLPAWTGTADAWFLDGFSPAKNPELWGAPLLFEIGQKTAPGGTCATYTAAGHVRRALEDAGFEVSRIAGYGRKRHMTRAVRRS